MESSAGYLRIPALHPPPLSSTAASSITVLCTKLTYSTLLACLCLEPENAGFMPFISHFQIQGLPRSQQKLSGKDLEIEVWDNQGRGPQCRR